MDCSTPGFPVLQFLPEFAQTHVHWVSDAIQPISSSVAAFSFCLQSFSSSGSFPVSQLCIRWPKYWSFSFSPSNECSGLISFRIDWFDLLAFQGDPEMSTLRNKTDFSFQTHLEEIGKFCWVNQG